MPDMPMTQASRRELSRGRPKRKTPRTATHVTPCIVLCQLVRGGADFRGLHETLMPPGAVLSLGVRCQLRCQLFSVTSSKPIECSLKQEFQGEDEKCSTNADWTGGAGCKVCWGAL